MPCFFVSVAPRTATLWCWQQVTRQGHEGQRVWQDKGKVRHMKNGYRAKGKLWSIAKVWDGSEEFFQQHQTSSETGSQVEGSVFLLCRGSERPTTALAWTAAGPRMTIHGWPSPGHFREQEEELFILLRQLVHPRLSQANQDLPSQPWGLFPFHLESDHLLSPSLPGKPSPQILRYHPLSKSSPLFNPHHLCNPSLTLFLFLREGCLELLSASRQSIALQPGEEGEVLTLRHKTEGSDGDLSNQDKSYFSAMFFKNQNSCQKNTWWEISQNFK